MTYAVRSKEGHVVRRFASHAEAESFVRTAQSPSRKTDRHTEKARLLQAWHEASAAVNRAKQAFDEAWRTDMRKVEPARKVLLKAVAVEERAHRKAARLEYSPSRRGPSEQETVFLRRWFSKKYGLSSVDVTKLLHCERPDLIERELEVWRLAHGLPAMTSPLTRGKLMEIVRKHSGSQSPSRGPAYVELSAAPNPDYENRDPRGTVSIRPHRVPVASFEEAARACGRYIAENGLGNGNWTGGKITDARGKVIAKVSYNGRVWPPGKWTSGTKALWP
jgi:hypothetical protein